MELQDGLQEQYLEEEKVALGATFVQKTNYITVKPHKTNPNSRFQK